MLLSVVMPARNEEGCIGESLSTLTGKLQAEKIPYEIVVVDDGSTDTTARLVSEMAAEDSGILLVSNRGRNGYGIAVRIGLERSTGDAIAVMMADSSDSPSDLVTYYRKLQEGYDCVFGSRFMRGGKVVDYPMHKLLVNRLANWFIRFLFHLPFSDITNAFKCYRRKVLEGMHPLISYHFNLTVEMPLKAVVRGFSYAVVPITWTNRKHGVSKLKIKEMGSRYLFIVLYLWLEKQFARGDYLPRELDDNSPAALRAAESPATAHTGRQEG